MEDKIIEKYHIASHYTEAVLDAETFEEESKVPIPREEAVEMAKEWVDEHEV